MFTRPNISQFYILKIRWSIFLSYANFVNRISKALKLHFFWPGNSFLPRCTMYKTSSCMRLWPELISMCSECSSTRGIIVLPTRIRRQKSLFSRPSFCFSYIYAHTLSFFSLFFPLCLSLTLFLSHALLLLPAPPPALAEERSADVNPSLVLRRQSALAGKARLC